MRSYKSRGIVLHTIKYGESSLIVYMFTQTHGRQTYMVQGVRSSRSKGNKAALFQPLFQVEFEGIELPHADMHRLKDQHNYLPYQSLPFDVRKSTISLFVAEVLYRLIREVEANEPLFDFVCEAVGYLDRMEDGVSNFHLWFLVQLSSYLGFYPGNSYGAGDYFDIQAGLFVHHVVGGHIFMSRDASRLLGDLMAGEVSDLGKLSLSRELRVEFMGSILDFFGYHFDSIHSVQSLQILREVF